MAVLLVMAVVALCCPLDSLSLVHYWLFWGLSNGGSLGMIGLFFRDDNGLISHE